MQQFKISEEGFNKFLKRWRFFMIPGMIIVLFIVSLPTIISHKADDINTTIYVVPFLAILFGFNIYRGIRKQKKFMLAYSVTISGEGITREQYNTPPLFISFMEIKEIVKWKKGGYMIKGKDRTETIYIPRFVEKPEELETALAALAPIRYDVKIPLYRKFAPLLGLFAIIMMICVYTLDNKIIVTICGALVAGLMTWAFYEIQRNKNTPRSTKRFSWLFILVIASIIYITYAKLTGAWLSL